MLATRTWALIALTAIAIAACGSSPPPDDPWQASARVLNVSDRWWWEPMEYACEEDEDCWPGESCHTERLSTCAGCPTGENSGVCYTAEGEPRRFPYEPD